jgi:hypothetical protein
MTTNRHEKQREVLILLISVIAISIITNFLAGILFDSLYHKYTTISIIISVLLLLILTLALYFTVVSSVTKSVIRVDIPLCFSRKLQRFIDLPRCIVSVRSRIHFDELPEEGRQHLTCYDDSPAFWDSDLNRFIDHIIQEALLTVVFQQDQSTKPGFAEIPYPNLPIGIRENHPLQKWIEPDGNFHLLLPNRSRVTTYGRNNSFLQINTPFGSINAEWEITYCFAPLYSQYFVNLPDHEPIEDYHDFKVHITLITKNSPWRMLSPKMTTFFDWTNTIERKLNEQDWKSSQIDRLFIMLKPDVENY